MEAHRIAVISDTHGLLRPEVVEVLRECETIFHAGDFDRPDILERLQEICPVRGVRGNVDREWAEALPEELECTLYGFRFYMIHNRKKMRKDLTDIEIVIYGHSHKYQEHWEENTRYLNPGSCGPRRFRLPVTMMLLTLYPQEHRMETERVEWETSPSGKAVRRKDADTQEGQDSGKQEADFLQGRDLHALIKKMIKEMRNGRSVAEIAARNHVEEEFAEQVCRFYVTHPGVDVEGILDRMERKNL